MTIIEIVLLVVGMVFILASFWVTEKLSPDELQHISELSKEEMGVMLEHELEKSRQRVSDIVEDTIDASKERTERSLEKQTNEKIMAINEYSDTVIEKMNKTHNEIMFLYSMLNDKHTELTDFTSGLTQQLQDLKAQEEEMTNYYLDQLKNQKPQLAAPAQPAVKPAAPAQAAAAGAQPAPVLARSTAQAAAAESRQPTSKAANTAKAAAVTSKAAESTDKAAEAKPETQPVQTTAADAKEKEEVNVKDEIIRLYEQGRDSVAIAKNLGLGVGEVRLILGLYKGD